MDTNNFVKKIGVGEREGRVFSGLVERRHFNMNHGIGRSGDVNSVQPKATGSSIILKLTVYLVKHALHIMNYKFVSIENIALMPFCTGMTLTYVFLTLKSHMHNAIYVILPRIDQKTCLKAIVSANLIPIVIENIEMEHNVKSNIKEIKEKLQEFGEKVLCVMSVTSCFAPRNSDSILEIGRLCKENKVKHIINNAYGL